MAEWEADELVTTLIDGFLLKNMFIAGADWLKINVAYVNALNVFPVPDGDTGTNMSLTLQAALNDIQPYTGSHAGQLAGLASQGALLGARGNSGVILSQILQGFAQAIADCESLSTVDLARAMQAASQQAYQTVQSPVEGTMLTVMKDMAQISQKLAPSVASISEFLAQVLKSAQNALQRTPELLPALKAAGVVDSGGQGLVFFFEGMTQHLQGKSPSKAKHPTLALPNTQALSGQSRYGYDVQFLIRGTRLNVPLIRQHVSQLGDSVLVVGDEALVKVHVHLAQPDVALAYGRTLGQLEDIVVENMDAQVQTAWPALSQTDSKRLEESVKISVLCVVPSRELGQICQSLGAEAFILGGTGAIPSAKSLLASFEQLAGQEIVLLPNHSNIVLVAQQAAKLFQAKPIHVVASQNFPQGLSALLRYTPQAEPQTLLEAMQESLDQVYCLELSIATKTALINNLPIQQGQIIGLINGEIKAHGQSNIKTCLVLLEALPLEAESLLTIYAGKDSTHQENTHLVQVIQQNYPFLAVELVRGEQLYYQYIISLE